MKKISQREARRMQRELARIENRVERMYNCFSSEWPGGVHVATLNMPDITAAKLRTARRLGFAVVLTIAENGDAYFYAAKG